MTKKIKYCWVCEECGERYNSDIEHESILCGKCRIKYSRCTPRGKIIPKE